MERVRKIVVKVIEVTKSGRKIPIIIDSLSNLCIPTQVVCVEITARGYDIRDRGGTFNTRKGFTYCCSLQRHLHEIRIFQLLHCQKSCADRRHGIDSVSSLSHGSINTFRDDDISNSIVVGCQVCAATRPRSRDGDIELTISRAKAGYQVGSSSISFGRLTT